MKISEIFFQTKWTLKSCCPIQYSFDSTQKRLKFNILLSRILQIFIVKNAFNSFFFNISLAYFHAAETQNLTRFQAVLILCIIYKKTWIILNFRKIYHIKMTQHFKTSQKSEDLISEKCQNISIFKKCPYVAVSGTLWKLQVATNVSVTEMVQFVLDSWIVNSCARVNKRCKQNKAKISTPFFFTYPNNV